MRWPSIVNGVGQRPLKSSLSPFPVPLQVVNLTHSVLEIVNHSNAHLIAKADYQNAIIKHLE